MQMSRCHTVWKAPVFTFIQLYRKIALRGISLHCTTFRNLCSTIRSELRASTFLAMELRRNTILIQAALRIACMSTKRNTDYRNYLPKGSVWWKVSLSRDLSARGYNRRLFLLRNQSFGPTFNDIKCFWVRFSDRLLCLR